MAAAASIMAVSAASAAEIGNTGINVGAELDTYWEEETDNIQSILTPSVGYSKWGIDFTGSTDLQLVTNDQITLEDAFDVDVLEFEAGYTLGTALAARAYVGTDFSVKDTEFSGMKAGISIKF